MSRHLPRGTPRREGPDGAALGAVVGAGDPLVRSPTAAGSEPRQGGTRRWSAAELPTHPYGGDSRRPHYDRVLRGEAVVGLGMGRGTWSWIAPDGLWEIAKPLIPPSKVRPHGGETQDTPDEEAVLHRLDDAGLIDVTRVVLDTAHVRAKKGATIQVQAPWTAASRVPRRTSCRTRTEAPPRRRLGRQHPRRRGAEAHDRGSPNETRSPQRPSLQVPTPRLHAAKAYDRADLRRWLRWMRIGVRIARKGIESSER